MKTTHKLLKAFDLQGYMLKEEIEAIVWKNRAITYIATLKRHGCTFKAYRECYTRKVFGYSIEYIPELWLTECGRLVSNNNNYQRKLTAVSDYKWPSIWAKIKFRFFTAL